MTKTSESTIALFDTDKTLVDITDLVNVALRETMQKHFDFSADLNDLQRDDFSGMAHRHIIEKLATSRGFEPYFVGFKEKEIDRTYFDFLKTEIKKRKSDSLVLPGVKPFLSVLKNNDIYLGVFSGAISEIHNLLLEVTDLKKFFEVSCTSDNSRAPNRVQLINYCVDELRKKTKYRITPQNVFVFGDTPNDIRAANEYNARSIGMLKASLYTREELLAAEPYAVYDSFEQYPKILQDLFEIVIRDKTRIR